MLSYLANLLTNHKFIFSFQGLIDVIFEAKCLNGSSILLKSLPGPTQFSYLNTSMWEKTEVMWICNPLGHNWLNPTRYLIGWWGGIGPVKPLEIKVITSKQTLPIGQHIVPFGKHESLWLQNISPTGQHFWSSDLLSLRTAPEENNRTHNQGEITEVIPVFKSPAIIKLFQSKEWKSFFSMNTAIKCLWFVQTL